jgi:hypothetical protein
MDKEVREYHASGGFGMMGIVVGLLLAVVIVIGGFFIYSDGGLERSASGPSVTTEAPSTSGSGGGKGPSITIDRGK